MSSRNQTHQGTQTGQNPVLHFTNDQMTLPDVLAACASLCGAVKVKGLTFGKGKTDRRHEVKEEFEKLGRACAGKGDPNAAFAALKAIRSDITHGNVILQGDKVHVKGAQIKAYFERLGALLQQMRVAAATETVLFRTPAANSSMTARSTAAANC